MNRMMKTAAFLSGLMMLSSIAALPASAAAEQPAAEETVMNAVITLNGDSATAEGDNVTVEGTKITIFASGAYAFSGTLTDGQIIVNVPDELADPGTVKLFFNGVNITGVSEAPVYVINAENTSINLGDGTQNYLSDGGKYTETTAVIYAKDDITIKNGGTVGDGQLTVESVYQDAIHCNNDVKISGGVLKVRTNNGDGVSTGIGDGIRGKTSVEIKGGDVDVNAGGDGVKSTKGDVFISGGHTEIKAGNDAVQGETSVQISGGELKANGDRGLTNAAGTGIAITGGEILATATDYQTTVAGTSTQPVVLFNTAAEQVKDQEIALFPSDEKQAIFLQTPDKKFDYVLISSSALTVGSSYDLYIGTLPVENYTFTLDSAVTTLTDVVSTSLMRGDLNNDSTVDVTDAMLTLNAYVDESILGLATPLTDAQFQAADVDYTGAVDISDAMYILNYYTIGLIGETPDWDTVIGTN